MKRTISTIAILLIVTMGLFATWNVGTIIDDFGDPTGDGFVYTTVEGTFSNSATSNSKACLRVVAEFSVSPYPSEQWVLEIHDYSWDNPVESFYDKSVATIKIKEEDGKIVTFVNKNSEYYHDWNTLSVVDGHVFTDMLKRNSLLKISISIEKYKYNFNIDCSDFRKVYDGYFSSLEPNIGKWYYFNESELLEYIKDVYTSIGITKFFAEGSYCYYGETNSSGKEYLYYFDLDNEDYDENKYLSFDVNLYTLDKPKGASVTKTKIESSDIKNVLIVAPNGKLISLKFKNDSSYTWTAQESIQSVVDSIAKGTSATLRISTKNGQTIDIPLDKEFAEYHEKAKTIRLI